MATPPPRDVAVDAAVELLVPAPGGPPVLDPARSPAAAERLGALVAEELRATGVDAVLTWEEDGGAAVLGHITARELGAPRVAVREDLGRLLGDVDRLRGLRAGLAALTEPAPRVLDPLRRLVSSHDGEIVATAVAVRPAELDEATRRARG
ncbi:hypothetical protein [Actinoalloteichus caeruleus]|uniref:hypothetical protein n=1 Tax=Actinoalloteichus cyanogriseus TaxID=2893586 RepID=UPI003BB868B1